MNKTIFISIMIIVVIISTVFAATPCVRGMLLDIYTANDDTTLHVRFVVGGNKYYERVYSIVGDKIVQTATNTPTVILATRTMCLPTSVTW